MLRQIFLIIVMIILIKITLKVINNYKNTLILMMKTKNYLYIIKIKISIKFKIVKNIKVVIILN